MMDNPTRTRAQIPAMLRTGALQVRARSITYLGEDVNAYELVPLEADSLPPFTAGAHIDLYFRDGRVRQYSLCSNPADTSRYIFAVQREENGRGGSKAIHEIVQVGRILAISQPRNNFPLHEAAKHHVLVAGGIGITPMVAMVYRLRAIGASFDLHYGARSPSRLAFLEHLKAQGLGDRLHVYVDGGDPARGMDLRQIASHAPPDAHIYCCGPEGLMRGMRLATSVRASGTVHFEHFAVSPAQPVVQGEMMLGGSTTIGVGFKVKLARADREFYVPDDKTIVDVLRENGIEVPTSCEAGLCGTCRTSYLQGEPDHRDYVLDTEERRYQVMICCSRSRTPCLVLDL